MEDDSSSEAGAQHQDQPTATVEVPSRQGFKARAKALGGLIRRYPHVLVVPLAVLGLLLGLGIWGVQQAGTQRSDNKRQAAVWEAVAAAQDLQLQFEQATLPLLQIQALAKKVPNVPKFLQLWDTVVDSLWKAAPPGSITHALSVQGVVVRNTYFASVNSSEQMDLSGYDSLATSSSIRALAVKSLYQEFDSTNMGPIQFNGAEYFLFTQRIAVSGVAENDTFGSGLKFSFCPPGRCYNATTRTKAWGTANMIVRLSYILRQSAYLQTLARKGHSWQLMRPGVVEVGEPDTMIPADNTYTTVAPPHAMYASLQAVNQQWELAVWNGDSWDDNLNYLYAVVVVGSVVISVLLFAVLLSWVENRALLHSLLPKETIDRMKEDAEWQKSQSMTLEAIKLETPAQGLLQIIISNLDGVVPPLARLVAMRDALMRSVDVYRPTASTIKARMEEMHVDNEVRRALVSQVFGRNERGSVRLGDAKDWKMQSFGQSGLLETSREGEDTDNDTFPTTADCLTIPYPGSGICLGTQEMTPLSMTDTNTQPLNPRTDVIMALQKANDQQQQSISTPGCVQPASLHDETGAREQEHQALDHAKPSTSLITEVEAVLATADTWEFDAYALERVSEGRPLSVMAYWLLQRTGLIAWAHMDTNKLLRFLARMESGYSTTNPYHNRRHAADVLQSMHVIIHRGGLMPLYVDQSTLLACYFAAIVHDYEHRGRNNDFLIHSNDELALTYNDRSPMENHHLAAAFKVLQNRKYDFLSGLSKTARCRLRKTVIDVVLSTDMKQHFATLGQFEAAHALVNGHSSERLMKINGYTADSLPQDLKPISENEQLLSLQMAMKCADLGHLTAPLDVHLLWVKDLEEEFFTQGDAERAAGLPVSPLCDRTKEGVFRSQVGFFRFVALPLYQAFTAHFKSAEPMRRALMNNFKHWESVAQPAS